MAEICVIYLGEDESVVKQLVDILRKRWDVWCALDISSGNWEKAVRKEIAECSAVVPVLSKSFQGERRDILTDEMRLSKAAGRPILPFLIAPTDLPMGFGTLNRTNAFGWNGEENNAGLQQLMSKIVKTIGAGSVKRLESLTLGRKKLCLPSFVFSLSSHETQVMPAEGSALLHALEPSAALVSTYDIHNCPRGQKKDFSSNLKQLSDSDITLFLDSGNYEADKKNDRYSSRKNKTGWNRKLYLETIRKLAPDIAFSFDVLNPTGDSKKVAGDIVKGYDKDMRAIGQKEFPLCPIVHLPSKDGRYISKSAPRIVSLVAKKLDPIMVAIPERELGYGLMERAKTVFEIRKSLNELGKYYPLHLLGTGNPITMRVMASAGADAFDGLEWCRTIADYDRGHLFHFHHFDLFEKVNHYKIQDQRIKDILENPKALYGMKALSYNIDFFIDWSREMQNMIHAGQVETLLKEIPSIGQELLKEISN